MRSSPSLVLWLKKSEAEAIRSVTFLIRSPRNSSDDDADSWSVRRHATLRRGWLDNFFQSQTPHDITPLWDVLRPLIRSVANAQGFLPFGVGMIFKAG